MFDLRWCMIDFDLLESIACILSSLSTPQEIGDA